MPGAPSTGAHEALTSRVLPQMQLSDGSAGSMTGPPPPAPHYLTPAGRAELRFSVEGTAISASSPLVLHFSIAQPALA